MLPILLYEPLPLIYLCGGAVMLAKAESGLLLISAFLFYWAGAIIWVIRSKSRRTDTHYYRYNLSHKFFVFPEPLYEFRPYFYSFIGILLFRNTGQTVWLVTGSLLILWAIFCLYRRSVNRRHLNKSQNKSTKLKTRLY